jgi:hypothetical protein
MKPFGEVLLGVKSVYAALLSKERNLGRLLVDRENMGSRLDSILKLAEQRNVPVESVSRTLLERFSRGGRRDQGVALKCGPRPIKKLTALPRSDWTAGQKDLGTLTSGDVKMALERWLQDEEPEKDEVVESKVVSASVRRPGEQENFSFCLFYLTLC